MKKHRIQDVYVWKSNRSAGFHLVTKNGIAAIPVLGRPGELKKVRAILKKHLPHLAEILLVQNAWDEIELKNLLIGKYCYGTAQEIETDSMIERRIT